MQDHRYSFEVDATPEEVWSIFWNRKTGDVLEHGNLRIEILHGGDENGEGLIRHCHFPVPKYLLSGGKAKSWEWLTEVKPCESWRYDAVGKPLWSKATGWTRLEPIDGNRTRVHFRETYHVFNPVMRFFLEKIVHRAISKDNDKKMKQGIEGGLEALARKRQRQAQQREGGQDVERKGVPDLSVHEAMFTLRAMRRLKPDPIADEDLCYIVEAATMACSPGNSQAWKFLIVTDPEQKQRVASVYRELGNRIIRDDALASGRLDEATAKVYRNAMLLVDNMQHAPALVLCCVHGRSEAGDIHQSSYYGGIYPAIQNLMLAARAKGIGSTLTTLHKAREQDIKAIFGIPEDVSTIALVPLGYPEGEWGRPRRKPQPEVTYWNRWGARNAPSPPD